MTLTKDDLAAIRELVTEVVDEKLDKRLVEFEAKIDEKFDPLLAALKQVLEAQLEIVKKLEDLERRVDAIVDHLRLSPTSRALTQTLKALD